MGNFLGPQRQSEEEPAQPSFDLDKLPDAAKKLIQELQGKLSVLEQQNQSLRQNEFYYRSLVEDQLELVCRTLPDGKLTFVNEAYCRYFGKSRGELLGSNFLDLIPSEDHASILCRKIEFTSDNPSIIAEHHVIDAQGRLRWNQWITQAFFSPQGELLEFQSIGWDITQQKATEQELQRHITEHKQAAEALQQAHRVADTLREILTILNSSLALEEVLAQMFAQLSRVIRYGGAAIFWPEGEDLFLSQGVGSIAQGYQGRRIPVASSNPVARVFRDKQLLVINEGLKEPHWMEWPHKHLLYAWIGLPLKVDQEVIGVLALDRYQPEEPFTLEDVQLLQAFADQAALAIRNARLYEALQASESRFRTISELTSNYAYSVRVEPDQMVSLEWFTSAFTQVAGHTFEGVEGPLRNLVIYPEDLPLVQEHMQRLLANQEDVTEYRIITTTGDIRWVRDYGRPVWDETENRIVHIINAAQDITERKQLEEQLYHAQKMDALGRLAGGVAHHFNNLLTAIIGFIELSMINLPAYHSAIEDLNQAHATSLRAAALTHQLIAFTRRQMVHPKLFNLNDLVRRGEALLARLIPVSVTFTTHLAPQVGWIKIDESQFEQILVNLVINACEAMPGGGSLTIQTAKVMVSPAEAITLSNLLSGLYARFTVKDTGVGISEDIQSRIFEPFFTTKDVGQGAGLGLSTCYGIVKQHGGEIIVDSRPGQGATFHIYFPRFEEAP